MYDIFDFTMINTNKYVNIDIFIFFGMYIQISLIHGNVLN